MNALVLILALFAVFLPTGRPAGGDASPVFPVPADLQPALANAVTEDYRVFLPLVISQLPTIVPESTNILTDESNQFLVSISADSAQFVFSQTTPELNRVAPGDIIVSDIAAKAPNGYLRKVLTKQFVDGQVILTTAAASLEEAIEQTSVSLNHQFASDDIVAASALPGVTLVNQKTATPNFEVISLQFSEVMLGGNLEVNGSFTLNLSMDFDVAIRRFSLESLRMVLQATETTSLQLLSTYESGGDEEYEIARYRLRPLTIMAGGFPIVVQPTIILVMGADGAVSASLTTGLTQNATLAGGVQYVDGNLSPVQEFTNDFLPQPPTPSAEMKIEAYVGAGLELAFYTTSPLVPELAMVVRAGPRLQADETLCWVLKGFLEVDLVARLKLFRWDLEEMDTTIVSAEASILQARQCTVLGVSTLYQLQTVANVSTMNYFDYNGTPYVDDGQLDQKWSPSQVVGDMSLASAASADAAGSIAHATSSGLVAYETMTNSLGVPSIVGATVTLDTGWSYNPNGLTGSSQSLYVYNDYIVDLYTHVAGDFVFTISSDVYSSNEYDAGNLEEVALSIGYPGHGYNIPPNGSLVITESVSAGSTYFPIRFLGPGIYNWYFFNTPVSGLGTARTTLEWKFFPGGVASVTPTRQIPALSAIYSED
ncbi:hypothetical protein [Caldilinea sp.]|uniref:hypothetical protein n=1 Tax=Caldilinea sp. TaxID=2293560 RepID=UPI002B72F3AD|nr:hypothetical protein [Caldilinea sp.]